LHLLERRAETLEPVTRQGATKVVGRVEVIDFEPAEQS
jgi:hypothetical protein